MRVSQWCKREIIQSIARKISYLPTRKSKIWSHSVLQFYLISYSHFPLQYNDIISCLMKLSTSWPTLTISRELVSLYSVDVNYFKNRSSSWYSYDRPSWPLEGGVKARARLMLFCDSLYFLSGVTRSMKIDECYCHSLARLFLPFIPLFNSEYLNILRCRTRKK